MCERIDRARDLDTLLAWSLRALDDVFGFSRGMILVPDDSGDTLVTLASHGDGGAAVGAEVRLDHGSIGRAAHARVPITDDRGRLAVPLLVDDQLIGVLALDGATPALWWETDLAELAARLASAIDRASTANDTNTDADGDDLDDAMPPERPSLSAFARRHRFTFHHRSVYVLVGDEYLTRNVPAKILWWLLRARGDERRVELSTRELRLDPWLGLPAAEANLEARLILLRRRLEQKCPDVRILPTRRGRFGLEVRCEIELVEDDG